MISKQVLLTWNHFLVLTIINAPIQNYNTCNSLLVLLMETKHPRTRSPKEQKTLVVSCLKQNNEDLTCTCNLKLLTERGTPLTSLQWLVGQNHTLVSQTIRTKSSTTEQ